MYREPCLGSWCPPCRHAPLQAHGGIPRRASRSLLALSVFGGVQHLESQWLLIMVQFQSFSGMAASYVEQLGFLGKVHIVSFMDLVPATEYRFWNQRLQARNVYGAFGRVDFAREL